MAARSCRRSGWNVRFGPLLRRGGRDRGSRCPGGGLPTLRLRLCLRQRSGDRPSAGGFPREQLWLTSKLWNDKHAPEDVIPACQKSLTDLRVDYLDAYLVHWPFPNHHAPGVDVTSRSAHAGHTSTRSSWPHGGRWSDSLTKGSSATLARPTRPFQDGTAPAGRPDPARSERDGAPPPFPATRAVLVPCGEAHPTDRFCPIGSPERPERDMTPEDTVDIEDPVVVRIAKDHGVHPAVVCVKWAVQRDRRRSRFPPGETNTSQTWRTS